MKQTLPKIIVLSLIVLLLAGPQTPNVQAGTPLREQSARGLEPVVAAASPLETAGIRRHRKAHAAVDGLDAEMSEQRRQVRIVHFVVDDEADVDRNRRAVIVDADGMAVAAGPEFAVVDGDRIMIRQGPGRGIAADSRPDHRDSHFCPSVAPL